VVENMTKKKLQSLMMAIQDNPAIIKTFIYRSVNYGSIRGSVYLEFKNPIPDNIFLTFLLPIPVNRKKGNCIELKSFIGGKTEQCLKTKKMMQKMQEEKEKFERWI